MHTLKRDLLKTISYLLNSFPAVVLIGVRQVGKSTLLKQFHQPGTRYFDLEKESDFERVNNGPELLFKEIKENFIFDEAQLSPKLFNALRVEIDKDRHHYGRFLLSGSSSPDLLNNITESLAGRCAIIEVNGLSWSEAGEKASSLFYQALEDGMEDLKKLPAIHTHSELLDYCLYGSYPEAYLRHQDKTFFDIWMESYIKSYIERDVRRLYPGLNLDAFKKLVKMISFSTGEIINFSNFARSLDVGQPTVKKYLEILENTMLWRKLPPYDKNSKKRLIKMPKGHLCDMGIVNYLLKIHTHDDLKAHPMFGRIWESFVIEQLIKGLQTNLLKSEFFYYRTSNHTEIDLIIEGRFGLIPIEIKSSFQTKKNQTIALQNFINEYKCPFGIVINNGEEIFKISETILQVPAIYI